MSRFESSRAAGLQTRPIGRVSSSMLVLLSTVSFAGCSADLGRFDFPAASHNGGSTRHAATPVPSETVRRNAGLAGTTESGYAPPSRSAAIEMEPLPGTPMPAPPPAREPYRYSDVPPAPAQTYVPPYDRSGNVPPLRSDPPTSRFAAPAGARQAMAMTTPPPAAVAPVPSVPAAPAGPLARARTTDPVSTPPSGNVIEVQPGDSLFSLSKRHRVSISELMSLNGLSSPALKPGQKLTLPSGRRVVAQRGRQAEAPRAAAAAPSAAPVAETVQPAPASAPLRVPGRSAALPSAPATTSAGGDWTGTHTLARGESLYAVSRRHNVKLADLQSVNGIADPTKLKPGIVLKVPASAAGASAPVDPPAAEPPSATPSSLRPTIINGAGGPADTRMAALNSGPSRSDAAPTVPPLTSADPAAAAVAPPKLGHTVKFRWPVKGKIVAGFGPRAEGPNDGINISVPVGTEVAAAEAGVVAYAGNELKGYGNLILVRHDENWISAYAYNDQLLVRVGDKVRRGQTIAKAGTSGTNQPQVHFELRQGSKPVDPMPYMERN
jgi:murein DD-endopeptidase MepM/ murein hydrolase activator NlpD